MDKVFTQYEPYEAPIIETIDLKLEGKLLQGNESGGEHEQYS